MAQINLLQSLVSNALEAVEFKLVRKRDDLNEDALVFHPEYAHQIFGESESIFGYKDLKIRLYYTAGPLNIFLGTKYSLRIDDFSNDGHKADDVCEKISELLTSGCYYTNIDEFATKVDKDETFVPMGEKVDNLEITKDGQTRVFEFYQCDITTKNFVAYHTKLQTFLLWFVDAGSYIDIEDPQWLFYLCFEKYTNSDGKICYATVGYTTTYLYYAYPANIRPRISQMLVLPPFQCLGIGSKFIEVIYNKFKSDPKVIDITVEDPSDEFRRIRNFVDVNLCKSLQSFAPELLRLGFSKAMINEARESYKINSKQCRIIYEILRLKHTNVHNENEYKAYRLDVKKRLNLTIHKQRQDIKKLEKAGLDSNWINAGLVSISERMEQLKDEYKEIEDEYNRILHRFNK